MNGLISLTFWVLGIILALTALLVFSSIVFQASFDSLSEIYAYFPETPSERYKTALSTAGTFIAFIGVISAIGTFWRSTVNTRRAQRKQHTITVLLETRLSEKFQQTIEQRRAAFPEYNDVTFEAWNNARQGLDENGEQLENPQIMKDGAIALTQLLNYYEFLAVGLSEGDLDETMLKKTIRSIMCNLVDDSRYLIAGMRDRTPSAYENLIELYEKWRKPNAVDINGKPNERPIPPKIISPAAAP